MEPTLLILLIVCLLAAAVFEFINGFHDTANAVAAVIYTRSLKPKIAVLMAGVLNFVGVYIGGIAVAMGIMNLLPTEMIATTDPMSSVAMVLAILIAAIAWNLGTWYLGLPCSSSHTLIGSILGAVWAFTLVGNTGVSMNWGKAFDILLSLLISPLVGFGMAWLMLKLLQKTIKDEKFYAQPEEGKKPPFWTRTMLILSSGTVSLAHGSNDGQKGVGLVMIILVALLPAQFALKDVKHPGDLNNQLTTLETTLATLPQQTDASTQELIAKASKKINAAQEILALPENTEIVSDKSRGELRASLSSATKALDKALKGNLTADENLKKQIKQDVKPIKGTIEYAPAWVLIMISLSLGLGTMFGWKRIVKTVGEKIGKAHFSYGHGISTSLMSALTIGASTGMGLPVSTTHIVSSSVAGGMSATGGMKNLQGGTIRSMLIAWALTLPVCILLSAGLYLALKTGLH